MRFNLMTCFGEVMPFYPFWNMDHEEDVRSVRRLAGLKAVSVLCTAHTGWTRDRDGGRALNDERRRP